jgi:hypothetical protein
MTATYYAILTNDDGATTTFPHRYYNKRLLVDHIRDDYGAGWTVHVMAVKHDGDNGWFEPEEIQTFRLRK